MKLDCCLQPLLASSLATARMTYTPQQPLPATSAADPPLLGYGTWNLKNASEAVSIALQTGYEHLDCAAAYGNEVQVGKGIKHGLYKTGKKRENIWVTSKLWNAAYISLSSRMSVQMSVLVLSKSSQSRS